jgi:hypothetical protein
MEKVLKEFFQLNSDTFYNWLKIAYPEVYRAEMTTEDGYDAAVARGDYFAIAAE